MSWEFDVYDWIFVCVKSQKKMAAAVKRCKHLRAVKRCKHLQAAPILWAALECFRLSWDRRTAIDSSQLTTGLRSIDVRVEVNWRQGWRLTLVLMRRESSDKAWKSTGNVKARLQITAWQMSASAMPSFHLGLIHFDLFEDEMFLMFFFFDSRQNPELDFHIEVNSHLIFYRFHFLFFPKVTFDSAKKMKVRDMR